jgi:LysM repeat protein
VRYAAGLALALLLLAPPVATGAEPIDGPLLELDELSPGFLGMYRKVMEIEDDIRRHAAQYGVDVDLARAVCLYESGGNAALRSSAGADGYFQIMPATFREMRVDSNIEAGVKYIGLMVRRFVREDRAVAAYNAGPARVGRNGGLPLETLQYVLGVGHYRSLLKAHDASIRHHASHLRLTPVAADETWEAIAGRVGVTVRELKLHNPFLATRPLRRGQSIAYPPEPRADLLRAGAEADEYRMRHGDNYLHVAFSLGVEPEALRATNGIWQLQVVSPGTVVRVPRGASAQRAAAVVAPVPPPARTHRVREGDTLSGLARRYRTTVDALRAANGLQRGSVIRLGSLLRIPEIGPVQSE